MHAHYSVSPVTLSPIVTTRAEACLGEFLKEIKAERVRDVRFQDMTNIIIVHALDESKFLS